MSETNPEIEAQLNALTEVCCESIKKKQPISDERVGQLSKALLMSGFEHKEGAPLSAQLEERVRTECMEPAMHRGAEIKAVTQAVQKKYLEAVKWESKQPTSEGSGPAKPANISSATDA